MVSPSDYQNLPGGCDKLSNFEQGFGNALLARMGTETAKLSLYQANHEKYLKAARSRAAQ
ncbi:MULTISPECIES: hypothetical protein [unclassified Streptomyces]|uniref:hypothetical protein n=1 Tax=unclassified Streptomyces TaxID=2593676 RepID=UPI00369C078E